MESWEHNIIRGKMDNLQGLPAGYLPNLESKWDIIEAGLPQQKKRTIPLLIRWSVAAAIVTGIFLIGVKINEDKETRTGVMTSLNKPLLVVPEIIEKEQMDIVMMPAIIKKDELQKTAKPINTSKILLTAKQDDKQSISSNEIENDQLFIPTIDSATINTNETATTTSEPEAPKRVKRRTFQKDFNDGVLVMDTGFSKPASQFGFKLQLHKSTEDDAQPSRRLQLKQVL
jgi:hypothetical protein